jgi:two-component system cell cycle response regulator
VTPTQKPEEDNRKDALTQLLNREGGFRVLEEAIGASPDRSCGVLILDIDNFQAFNAQYGYRAGDLALVELASWLAEALGSDGELARLGGEEFLALLPDATPDVACAFAERVCERVRNEPFELPEVGWIRVTTSIGVACAPGHGATAETVVRAADRATYESKRNGSNRWTLATY